MSWSCFFRVGTGTLQANEIEFDESVAPIAGGGAKVTFYRGESVDLDALFQWNAFDGERTGFIDAFGANVREEIRIDEQHLAIGATVHMDGRRLYGGTFYYVFDGNVTITDIADRTHKIRADVEEESEYGGYIGGRFDLAKARFVSVEYGTTGRAWGLGISLTRMF